MKLKSKATIAALASLSVAATVFATAMAQEAKKTVSPPQATKDDKAATIQKKPRNLDVEYVTFTSDESTHVSVFKTATVRDQEDGTTFRADDIVIKNRPLDEKPKPGDSGENQIATATGNMSVTDKQADITGEKCVTHFAKSKRLAVVTGNVVIQVKPKKDKDAPAAPAPVSLNNGKATLQEPSPSPGDEGASSARKNPATITCDKLEYQYAKDKKHALLTGNFKVVQKLADKTRTLTAEHAEWLGLEEKLILYPPVHAEDTKGMIADSMDIVTVLTKEGVEGISMKKGTAVVVVPDDDDDPPTKPTPANTPPANPTSPVKKPDPIKKP